MSSNNNFFQCIFCDKINYLPSKISNFIKNYNRGKDIYFNNLETKKVVFANYCYLCYNDGLKNGVISHHEMSVPDYQ